MHGLLLVDHGSRRSEANAMVSELADRIAGLRPDALVSFAHLELAEPSIADGVADLARRGATAITVILLFLTDGRHAREDVPRLAEAAATAHGIAVRVGPPLGVSDALAELLLARAGC